ncbi:hypothetical protein BH11PLA2_BH11PLA2_49400 [soil metagenome]
MIHTPRRIFRSWLELLEDRVVPTVQPLTLADPSQIGLSGLGRSQFQSLSADGQIIAFKSDAPDLVPNDFNGLGDIILYNRSTGRTDLVSVNAAGTASGNGFNGDSSNPVISRDGRYIIFDSASTDLAPNTPFFTRQLFVRDLQTGKTSIVSQSTDGVVSNRDVFPGSARFDSSGTKILFVTDANNLVLNDTNLTSDVFIRDLVAGTTVRASVAADGSQGNNRSDTGSISGDGRFVAFSTLANNFGVSNGTGLQDIWVKDLQTGALDYISIDAANANYPNQVPLLPDQALSNDGRFVLFETSATNISGLPTFSSNIYLRDRTAKITSLITINATGTAAVSGAHARMTGDGRYVSFASPASDLDTTVNDNNGNWDVFVRDLKTSTTHLVSVDPSGTQSANVVSGFGIYPNVNTPAYSDLTPDGRYIVFQSDSTNITVDAGASSARRAYVRDLQLGVTKAVTPVATGSFVPVMSDDGSIVAVETGDSTLVPGDRNGRNDIVVRNVTTQTNSLASHRSALLPPDVILGGTLVSATPDGRYVSFNAGPSNDYAPGINFTGFQTASAYVRDTQTGQIQVVDLTPDPSKSGGGFNAILTPDGRYAVFGSRPPTGGSTPLVNGVNFVTSFFGRNVYRRDLVNNTTIIIDVDPAGTASANSSGSGDNTSISNDGRYIAFTSTSDNLVAGITNPSSFNAIYQRDLVTGVTTLVSKNLAANGTISGNSGNLSMTGDGRYILFTSSANDLASNDTNNNSDIFQWDRTAGVLSLVSVNNAGTGPGNHGSGLSNQVPVMSADGRYIAFGSLSSDLTSFANDLAGSDIYRRDMLTGTTTFISLDKTGTKASNDQSTYPSISDDGSRIAFVSLSSDLNTTPIPIYSYQEYVRDFTTNTTTTVSVTAAGTKASNNNITVSSTFDWPHISPDGKQVVFRSLATDLVNGFVDANGGEADVYVRNLANGVTTLATANQSGTAGGSGSGIGYRFLFTNNNQTLLFDSNAPDLTPGDRNGVTDVFTFDLTGTATITGSVFRDDNTNGVQDGTEPGLAGLPVFLDAIANGLLDVGETRLQSDAQGNYSFRDLNSGLYRVGSVLDDGFSRTTPGSQSVNLETLFGGVNFGAVPAVADLAVAEISGPVTVAAGRNITVNWTVRNVAATAISGSWQDAVYLSSDKTLDASDVLLGTVPHTGGLIASGTYAGTATLATPATLEGDYYYFVQTDRRRQVTADTNRTNNVASSFDATSVTIPTLTLGTPTNETFNSVGQNFYYQVTVAAGTSLRVALSPFAVGFDLGIIDVAVAFNRLPTQYDSDVRQLGSTLGTLSAVVPTTQAGTYYVLATYRGGFPGPFKITASPATYSIDRVGPNSGSSAGRVTLEIHGTALTPATQATLVHGGTTLTATTIDFRDASLLYATFNLSGTALGVYDVRLADGALSAMLTGGFTVVAPTPITNPLVVTVTAPASTRALRGGVVLVEYQNTSQNDIPAPLLTLTSDKALLRLPGDAAFEGRTVSLLGISTDGPAGILRPGQRGTLKVEYLSTTNIAHDTINFQSTFADRPATVDWASQKNALRPPSIPADAWDAIFLNFLSDVGTTAGDLEDLLDRAATHLSSLGQATADVRKLMSFLIQMEDGRTPSGTTAVIDSEVATPGNDLVLTRFYDQSISGRFRVGPFGRGWTHNWQISTTTEPSGNVTLREGDRDSYFTRLADGSYAGLPGEYGTLTLTSGNYRYTTADGTITQFRPDGLLNYREDVKGNRVTAGYDSGLRLTNLTHSSGAIQTLTYNADNRIASLTDSEGHTVTYSYDAGNQHLTSYSDLYGTHTYTYDAGAVFPVQHALTSINFSDDTHITHTYDSRGRLSSTARDGGQQSVTYAYPFGEIRSTTATGGTTIEELGLYGRTASVTDPLGRITRFGYDAAGNLTNSNSGGGLVNGFEYDSRGNLVSFNDPAGNKTRYTYDSRGDVTSLTDALGNTTTYSYDSESNLVSIAYPQGPQQSFTYDGLGNPIGSVNRRGQAIAYTYDSAGRLTHKTSPAGNVSYAYDSAGRLTSSTDSSGTTTYAYNSTDSLTMVSYPNGKFIQYTLNVIGDRTRSVDSDGFTVNYIYDDLGRLGRVNDGANAPIVLYTRDAAGRVTREDHGNGTATVYAYNLAGQVASIKHLAPGGGTNSRYDYAYDTIGRVSSQTLTDLDAATPDGVTTYGYDTGSQLVSVSLPGGRVITYQYDAAGNRVSVTDTGVTTNYLTNALNQYTQVGTESESYDADGNLIAKTTPGGTTTFSYDAENRLTGVSVAGLAASYTYDAFGFRSSSTVNSQTTRSLLDPTDGSLEGEYDGGGVLLAKYTYGLGLVSRVAGGSSSYYDFDSSFNTVGLTNAAGAYANRYGYLPFGETTTYSAGLSNPFTFLGQLGVSSDGSKLFNLGGQQYDANLGRYVSINLFGSGANSFLYAGNAPAFSFATLASLFQSVGDTQNSIQNELQAQENSNYQSMQKLNQTINDLNNQTQADRNKASEENRIRLKDLVELMDKFDDFDSKTGAKPDTAGKQGGGDKSDNKTANDPNEIIGANGFGAVRFVTPNRTFGYRVNFENLASATASAQEVFVTIPLDADLDFSTVELGDFGFGSVLVHVPTGLQSYSTRVSAANPDGSPLFVDINGTVNIVAGTVLWTFRSVDPNTGLLPNGVFEGLLPPEDGTGRGDGFVSFSGRPRAGLPTNRTIDEQASIIFDTSAAIATNLHTNTVDVDAPTSSVGTLPSKTSNANIPVTWSGSDIGSGVATYTVFVSIDGAPATPWLTDTPLTGATYPGAKGHTYGFSTVATDNVGLVQSAASTVQTVQVTSLTVAPAQYAVGRDQGGIGTAILYNADKSVRYSVTPYGTSFTGGIRTAAGDFTGDGIAELVVASGPGRAGNVRVLDGVTQAQLFDFSPFGDSFTRGIVVTVGDITGDGKVELVLTAESGGGARVRIFSPTASGFTQLADFIGIIGGDGKADTAFRGGGRAAVGDVDGDGFGDLIFAAGAGGGPRIAIFSGKTLGPNGGPKLRGDFFAFEPSLRDGTYVAAGDFDGDGKAELFAGAGPGGGPRVSIFDGSKLLLNQEVRLRDFFAGDVANRGGIRVAVKNLDNDNLADLIAGAGPGGGSRVTAYAATGITASPTPLYAFDAFASFTGGVYVG